ncbi:oleate hydratase [Frigidibacter sp. MR17.24]|uniref:oleate hydratase n=1 Tax=Frigidibacter sp. MR17.24 TaxID=3127345 RepID=UPI003012FBE1
MVQSRGQHHIVGGGIAGLATAVFLLRDAGVPGADIHIHEQLDRPGGSLDGSGDARQGYLVRGGRMFEEHFACTLDLLAGIPSADDPAVSAAEDILAFNRAVHASGNCRIVRGGRPAADRDRLGLGRGALLDLARLVLRPERSLGDRTIAACFRPAFFDSNFWLMWATMFSFQPWHSAVEMRRYLRRFIHLFPGFTRIEGVLRTRYNQHDAMIAPMVCWLRQRGVDIAPARQVTDLTIGGTAPARRVTRLAFADGTALAVGAEDRVYLTLGSITEGSATGSADRAPDPAVREGGGWGLWRRLAAAHPGFGRPEAFCGTPERTSWTSFTVTLDRPGFFALMEDFTGNRAGTGGLVSFAGSAWGLSIVLFHQPHFRDQAAGTQVFWGYGLCDDRPGEVTGRTLREATGTEILAELAGQLGLSRDQRAVLSGARVVPCRMPFITSVFMARRPGDRPAVCPDPGGNFAVIGQFCELERDCVFTVEYSVRSARAAVAQLTGRTPPPPPVARTDRDPRVVLRALRVLLGRRPAQDQRAAAGPDALARR